MMRRSIKDEGEEIAHKGVTYAFDILLSPKNQRLPCQRTLLDEKLAGSLTVRVRQGPHGDGF